MTPVADCETITERACNSKMIAGAQFRQFPRSWTAHEEQNAGPITSSFIDTESCCGSFSSGRNCHQEL
ncbi:MAG TPA: hypothetical protein VGZ02_02735, partial [Candidatus Baltobacteraceae bacterium]|nr:hypothetical protein [Candidatus Baltobacteraceae bacterium]